MRGFDRDYLKSSSYFGIDGLLCHKQIEKEGVRLRCTDDLGCIQSWFYIQEFSISKDHYLLSIFNHVDDQGTKHLSSMVVNEPQIDMGTINLYSDFIAGTYQVNPLVDLMDNLDVFKQNIDTMSPSLKQLDSNQHLLMCMTGDLFNGNSLIKGIKLFNFKI